MGAEYTRHMRSPAARLVGVSLLFLFSACSVQTNVTRKAPEETAVPQAAPVRAVSPTPAGGGSAAATVDANLAAPIAPPVSMNAAPCASAGRHLSLPIPSAAGLDLSYRGAVPGIEIRRTAASGTGGWRHATRKEDALEVDVWSRGSGIAVGALGSETCKGGDPADVRFEFIGHYLRSPDR